METLNILIILATIARVSPEESKCHQTTINGVNYVQEILKSDIDKPYNLAIDKERDIVYFSYGTDVENDKFNTAYIHLQTKGFTIIEGVENGFTQTVDNKTHDVYIGGSNGLYKIKHGDAPELIAEQGTDIWFVYFNKVLYFSTFPTQFFYTYDGEVRKFKELEDTKVDQFVIDNGVIYYTYAQSLIRKENNDSTTIETFENDNPRCIFNDDGEIYLCIKDCVYFLNKESNTIEKLFNATDVNGPTIDNDKNIIYNATDVYGLVIDNEKNIIYSDKSNVYRLIKNKTC